MPSMRLRLTDLCFNQGRWFFPLTRRWDPEPGEVSRPYKDARVILRGKKRARVGKGEICQVSTTVLTLSLRAGLEIIVNVHPHSQPVDYVALPGLTLQSQRGSRA